MVLGLAPQPPRGARTGGRRPWTEDCGPRTPRSRTTERLKSASFQYPVLVHHAITSFGSAGVMRFLGGRVHGNFKGEITGDFCPEATIQNPEGFKVFRPKEGDPRGKKEWRPMRKGIADLHRRAQVSQGANERYMDALASVETSAPLGELLREVCRPTTYNGKRIRALRPWSADEVKLFEAANRGEFCLNGLRNRDLQALLFSSPTDDPKEKRRRSSRISHLLRVLRAHGILHKVPKSHRYRVTPNGRDILTAVLTAHHASLKQLIQLVA